MYKRQDYENVIILRTFSKAQGLAGLRVGYSVSHPQITQHLRVAATPFAVTALAEAAAIASIEHEDAVMERVSHLVAERDVYKRQPIFRKYSPSHDLLRACLTRRSLYSMKTATPVPH